VFAGGGNARDGLYFIQKAMFYQFTRSCLSFIIIYPVLSYKFYLSN